jgi:hypothetical protein
MSPDGLMKGVVTSYLACPQGMEMVHDYLASKEGLRCMEQYLLTPQGKKTALDILPLVLEAVDLPSEVKNSVRENLGRKT